MMNYTLQWYGIYAATVRLYKDTYIYLYKNTCSYLLQLVDNFYLINIISYLGITTATIFISGCSHTNPSEQIQNAALHLEEPPHKYFQQWPGDQLHPSAYYTCGKYQTPCHLYSAIKKSGSRSYSSKTHSSDLSKKETKKHD